MCPPPPGQSGRRFWGRSRMREERARVKQQVPRLVSARERACTFARDDSVIDACFRRSSRVAFFACTISCSSKPDPNTLVMIIESSPTNLDPRVGLDAQSERIDDLIFDDLLTRDAHLNVQPGLAERWEIPDPRTYVFHLHQGVKFHDGRPLTARDVKWTFDSLLQGKIRSTKSAVYRFVDHIDATDDYTVVFHLKEPFATLLWNLSDGAIGIVPYGSGDEMSRTADWLGAVPLRQRGTGQRSGDRAQRSNIGERRRAYRTCALSSCPTPPRAPSNCAKAAPTSPSTRSPQTWS